MKRFAFFCTLAVMALVACKNNSSEQSAQAAQDSLRRADSLAAIAAEESARAQQEKRLEDSLAWVAFQSKDLVFYELHGHVKSLKMDYRQVEFDENGMITLVDGKDPFNAENEELSDAYYSLSRNEEGYICSESGWEWATDYTWKDGRIVSYDNVAEAWTTKATYKYDDEGNIIEEKGSTSEFEGETETFRHKYTYTKRDDHGNWTECKSGDDVKKRTITYYEFPSNP